MNRTAKRRTFFYYLKNDWDLYVMILPAIVLFFIFKYIPMYGVTIAFKKYDLVKGIFASDWVGFKYFVQFFNDPYFFRIVKNTLMINVYSLIFVFPAPAVLALLLNELKSERLKRIAQSFSYLPHFISTVVVVGILMKLAATDGVINALLGSLGLPEQSFFGDARWFRTLYISSDIWQGVGWGSILYLAALTGVPLDRYEAAVIDGANRWQQMKHITLPGIMPTIVILFILNMGHMLEVGFEKVYLMYNPAIYDTADVISTYVYRRGIQGLDFGYAAAIGLFDSVVAFILLVTVNQMSKKLGQESLW
ncbi:MAG: sugar ABC transporter permease [Paenibacillaceae bacterium]|nr:sugar ABC transporter permease [Paenibacillaceae bacterium]